MEQKVKILVVEDEALTSLMICNELNKQGYDAFNELLPRRTLSGWPGKRLRILY